MLKMIWIQLWNRRRSNIWIGVELLLVFCLLWYVVDYLFVLQYNLHLPSCRSMEHVWKVRVNQLPETHPDYKPAESDSVAIQANYFRLLDRIRESEGVVAIAVIHQAGSPGSGTFMGNSYTNQEDTTREVGGQSILLDPSLGDFFRVFHYTDGEGNPVSVADYDWADPHAILVGKQTARSLFPDGNAVGKMIGQGAEGDAYMTRNEVKGVVGDIKRFDYLRPQSVYYLKCPVDYTNWMNMEITVRSSDQLQDAVFLRSFKEKMYKELRIGNFYLKNVQSYEKIEKETEMRFGQTGTVRTYTAMLIFFLLNIMLCLIGTFWYRIRIRREEIGLRMAMGSTRGDIRWLFLFEGLCLMSVMAIPAILINIQFVYAGLLDTLGGSTYEEGLYLPDRVWIRFLITTCLTWLVLAIAILVAVWLPADRASKMAPADALHYE